MEPAPAVRVVGLDHLVLRTSDVERSLEFYCGILGLPGERIDEWREGTAPFPSVRIDGTTIIDLFAGDRDGVNVDHVCVVVEPTDLEAVAADGRLEVLDGPVPRWGAQGMGHSLYVKDPDDNVVELRWYG